MKTFAIGSAPLSVQLIKSIIEQKTKLHLSENAITSIKNCRDFLDQKMARSEAPVYGINTGFGYLQNVRIADEDLSQLQHNLLRSHACGTGDLVPKEIIKLMLLLKIQSLSYGNSGVDISTVERLTEFYNLDVLPVVYTQGSLGASGDLSPLAHLSLPLIGEGEVWMGNEKVEATVMLDQLGLKPLYLKSKEGLALINGTQFMSAYGVYILMKAEKLSNWADIIGALSADAFNCRIDPFKPASHQIRPHHGQVATAEKLHALLSGSELMKQANKQVQDPYSFRCMPQVHGASKDTMNYVRSVFETEINSVTDNPNVFPALDEIISAGNFHGQPLALALDFLCIALAEWGSISERRTFQLISGQRNLPAFLVKEAGLNSGLMIPQYTAAAIASENKQLSTPSSVDSIVSSNGQEDHVSMGANGAVKCLKVALNLERILAIECLNACQAMEFRRPLKTAPELEKIIASYRKLVAANTQDRVLAPDIEKSIEFLQNYPI
ncbi:MAG: histidine ammonia-lyase [Bacteroidota bacterium]|jgi:histidine ammonia-lyase